MIRPDDSTLPSNSYADVRRQADLLLRKANAYGRFPTPVDDLIAAANLSVAQDDTLDSSFLSKLYRKVEGGIKRALDKVLGLLDGQARTIYLDQSVHQKKKVFLSLHEVGHDFLPWQRDMFAILEDSELSLDPDVREQFEREANVFTTEVLFQLDGFTKEAADYDLGISVPIRLAKRYGASVYSSIRRYVTTNHRQCAVLVYNQPEYIIGSGSTVSLRRSLQSPLFTNQFGEIQWPAVLTADDSFFGFLPIEKKFSASTTFIFRLAPEKYIQCVAEAFNSTYQIFILIYPASGLRIVI